MAKQTVGGKQKLFDKQLIVKDFKLHYFAYITIIPVLAWYIIFCYAPMWGVLLAFKDYKPFLGFWKSEWIGFKHFQEYITGPYFNRTVSNTFILNLWGLVLGFPAPLLLALFLNETTSNKYKRVVQTVTYMPHFISLVVVCGILRIFTASNGVITQLVNFISGSDYNSLLSYSSFFRPIYTFSGIWQGIGWSSIIYLSAISSVDPSLYEAAEMDGCGRFLKMWHITISEIRPTIIILFIFAMGGMMASGHEKIILLYNPLTYETADVIASYVYRRGISEGSFSFSTAVGLMSTTVNFALLWFTNKIAKKYSEVGVF